MKLPRLLGLLTLICCIGIAARAADLFEGVMVIAFSSEITDPTMKAQMTEAQKQMADPEMLARMKAMLEDPMTKAQMEKNPQMRSALEAQIKVAEDAAAGKGGDMMSAMMPKSMTVRLKNGNSHAKSEGGAMAMEMIALKDSESVYWIDRKNRSYNKVSTENAKKEAEKTGYKVAKTGGKTKVLGYSCDEYTVELTHEGQKIDARLWATKDIPGMDNTAFSNSKLAGFDMGYMKEIEGVPLKMEMKTPQMNFNMVTTSIRQGTVSDSYFQLPAGFKDVTPKTPAGTVK